MMWNLSMCKVFAVVVTHGMASVTGQYTYTRVKGDSVFYRCPMSAKRNLTPVERCIITTGRQQLCADIYKMGEQ